MEVAYSAKAQNDIEFCKKSGKKNKEKIAELIEDINIHPILLVMFYPFQLCADWLPICLKPIK